MKSLVRFAAVLAMVVGGLTALSGVAGANSPTCTDSWTAAVSGNWNTGANWSTGSVPSASDNVCITVAGTYTVTLSNSGSAASLTLGGSSGTQTLDVLASPGVNSIFNLGTTAGSAIGTNGVLALDSEAASGSGYTELTGTSSTLTNNGTLETLSGGTNTDYLRVNLTNTSSGTVTIGSSDTVEDQATTTINDGAYTVAAGGDLAVSTGTFSDNGGTLTNDGALTVNSATFNQSGGTESANAVALTGSATLNDSSGAGGFALTNSNNLTGTIPSGQTVTVLASPGINSITTIPSNVTNNGTLALDSEVASGSGYTELTGTSFTLTNNGTFETLAGGTSNDYLRVNLTNTTSGTVTIGSSDTVEDQATTTINDGTYTVAAGGGLAVSTGTFSDNGGTLTNDGALTVNSATFNQSGGTESANAVALNGSTLNDSSGAGGFVLTNSNNLTGTIPSGQTVTVLATPGINSTTTIPASVTNNGTLVLDSEAASGSGYTQLAGTSFTLTNNGTFETLSDGTNTDYVRVNLTNTTLGTVSIGSSNTHEDQATTTINDGTFTVAAGGDLAVSTGTFSDNGGTLTNDGTLSVSSATFNQSGGTESANAVALNGSTLNDSSGAGGFVLTNSNNLTGTIPSGQTVTVLATPGINSTTTIPSNVTNNGTLALDSEVASGSGYAILTGSGFTLTNNGTFETLSGGTNTDYLRVNLTNTSSGTVSIGSPNSAEDQSTTTTNDGTFAVADGGKLSLGGSSVFSQGTTGTFEAAVDANTGVWGLVGGADTVAGTLAVTTTGSPALGNTYKVISGANSLTGTFSTLSFGPEAYAVSYPTGAVELTTEAPYTVSATSFTASKDIATGPVQVATIGAATNGTGTYSATVDWGDGSANSTATVTVTGSTGTVTAPSHTYARSGPYTVTTTVANTDGTSIPVSVQITVPTLAVTGVSPATGPIAGGTPVTITGTGFTGATTVAFGSVDATNVTVVSDTEITATSPAQNTTGVRNVVVTTPGGPSPVVPADQFEYVYVKPAVTGVSPATGPIAGGTPVTITGTGFTGTTEVLFGTVAATNVTVVSDTEITATSPAQASSGTFNVYVKNPAGESAAVTADRFKYVYVKPAVSGVSPNTGPIVGGTPVTITGTGFTGTTEVLFGTVVATNVTVVSDTEITATSPAQTSSGTFNVYVKNPAGKSAAVTADQFKYVYVKPAVTGVSPNTGPIVGGTPVTITGTGFTGTSEVLFGTVAATNVTVVSDTEITATSPAQTSSGTFNVYVKNPAGQSAAVTADQFKYVYVKPAVTGVSPNTGPIAGGTPVTITGTGFTGTTEVLFGTVAATDVTVISDTEITVTSPAQTTAGSRNVYVKNPAGESTGVTADLFTYT